MPFMKLIRSVKGVAKKKNDIVLIEEDEIREGVSVDAEGNEYPSDILAPLTEEEAARCLKVEELAI